MSTLRSPLTLSVVLLLALLLAACGSDDSSSTDSADEGARTPAPQREVDSPEDTKAGGGGIAITPELTACMTAAGFAQDEPALANSLASWSHADGARVALAPSPEAALGLAGEIGTADAPANVDGARVSTGPPALVGAAAACLDT